MSEINYEGRVRINEEESDDAGKDNEVKDKPCHLKERNLKSHANLRTRREKKRIGHAKTLIIKIANPASNEKQECTG